MKRYLACFSIIMLIFSFAACDMGGDDNGEEGGSSNLVTIKAIEGVIQPVSGALPATAVTATAQFTGAISWNNPTGSHPAGGNFDVNTVYTAVITLTHAQGFSFNGLEANFFTVAGATATNPAGATGNTIVVTATFPATAGPANITDNVITGIAVPTPEGTPAPTITAKQQFGPATGLPTGTTVVTWSPPPTGTPPTFEKGREYTATIILAAATGYTLAGLPANFFTVPGASIVTHQAVSTTGTTPQPTLTVTAIFPETSDRLPATQSEIKITPPVVGATPATLIEALPPATAGQFDAGPVTWIPTHPTFQANQTYTALVTLENNSHSVDGLASDFFTVPGSISRNYTASSRLLTVTFPPTAAAVIPEITISTSPAQPTATPTTITGTGTSILNVSATVDPASTPLTYEWFKVGTPDVSQGQKIDDSEFETPKAEDLGGTTHQYYVIITATGAEPKKSNNVTVTVE